MKTKNKISDINSLEKKILGKKYRFKKYTLKKCRKGNSWKKKIFDIIAKPFAVKLKKTIFGLFYLLSLGKWFQLISSEIDKISIL